MSNDTVATNSLPANPYNSHAWIVGTPEIGESTWIGAFCVIDGSGGLTIGSHCDISAGAQIYTHSSVGRCLTDGAVPIERLPTSIGNNVHIGANAVILMGAQIGHHSIIGAGAVVKENTVAAPYSVIVGVPARVMPDAARRYAEQEPAS